MTPHKAVILLLFVLVGLLAHTVKASKADGPPRPNAPSRLEASSRPDVPSRHDALSRPDALSKSDTPSFNALDSAAAALIAAYPEAAFSLVSEGGDLYLESAGRRILFSPGTGCPALQFADPGDPPVCSTLLQNYPVGQEGREPAQAFEPGRVRSEALLKLLYGENEASVRKNLEQVSFFGQTLQFNGRHGAARALSRVAARLEALAAEQPELAQYIVPVAGHFYWRTIAGSGRLSAHSFGIAIDLHLKYGPYWRWSLRDAPEVRQAKTGYPQAIVDAFEAEGFIWGGKWYSFDFMHFEYRPELLPPGP